MERTNIRFVTQDDIDALLDFASVDVAFISLKLVLPVAYSLLGQGGKIVALIKPQFEAGRDKVGKKGVVRDIAVHEEVVKEITDFAQKCGFFIYGLDFSPIRGPEGNIEYLMYAGKENLKPKEDITDEYIEKMIEESHKTAK